MRATRITYVGELGWELYVPAEFAVGVYEDLMAAGADLGVANAGYYAIESLRLEKGYRAFGRELTPDYNPVEAGLLFACKLGTGTGFLGREAVEKARAAGPRRRLVSVVLGDPGVMMWGGELLLRDGEPVGQVTSAAWGETLGAAVGLAYLRDPAGGPVTAEFVRTGQYQVNVGGQLVWPRPSACGRRTTRRANNVRTSRSTRHSSPQGRRRAVERSSQMTVSVFDLFKIGIGPSSSHTVGPMRAAALFARLAGATTGCWRRWRRVRAELFGSLGATGHGHGSVKAVVLGLSGEQPETVDPAAAESAGRRGARRPARCGCSAAGPSPSTSMRTSSCTGASGCSSTPTACGSPPWTLRAPS